MDAPEEPQPPVVYTMENKPIVTCAGDQNLFTSIYPTLSQQLPREPMEWRRSYGRAPKMIHLESNFVQFKEELLPKEGNKALLTFPFLHIYWTECCDTEVYKATVKDDLTKWQNVLKAHSSVDWLIVVVENDAKKKNKTNILPRTSIVDKIRNDFCNKQSDRCVVLSDPLKDSSRTQRKYFCQEILSFASQQEDNPGHKVVLPMQFARLKDLHFDPPNAVVHAGGVLTVEITVCSQMPIPVHVDQIAVNVHFSIEKNNYRKTAEWLTKHKTSNGIITFPAEASLFPASQNSLPALELSEMLERSPSDNSLNTTGIICRNVHMLLRRQESGSSLEPPSGLALEDGAHVLRCSSVTLQPGANKIAFKTQAKEPGTYTLRQLRASVGPVWFVLVIPSQDDHVLEVSVT